MGVRKKMDEIEEAMYLNKLIQSGFKVFVKLKRGKKEVESITLRNRIVITRTKEGLEIIESASKFQKREFSITPKKPEPNRAPDPQELYNILLTKKKIIYRDEVVTEIDLVEGNLVIRTNKNNIYILTPSELFEYPIYAI